MRNLEESCVEEKGKETGIYSARQKEEEDRKKKQKAINDIYTNRMMDEKSIRTR